MQGQSLLQHKQQVDKSQDAQRSGEKANEELEEDSTGVAEFHAWNCQSQLANNNKCITSPNYPQPYATNEKCWFKVQGHPKPTLKVETFNTELDYDTLKVNNVPYSGTSGPEQITIENRWIEWTSDYSEGSSGWKICIDEGDPPTPAPATCGAKGLDDTIWNNDLGLLSRDPPIFKPRIVNGQAATECEWKWQAALRGNDGGTFCGGALIHPNWVMSAAHCVPGVTPSDLKIVLGDLDKNNVGSKESSHSVSRIIAHPSYNPDTMENDFALIELSQAAPMTDCIGTVCLPQDAIGADQECWITGWGTVQSGGHQPRFLQEAKVQTLSNSDCQVKYSGAVISAEMLCAQGRRSNGDIVDGCQGDSGGPLVCSGANGGYSLHGATSWGYGCANVNYPGIWARITSVLEWVYTEIPSLRP